MRRFPAKIDTYYEPFIGSGAVFLGLAEDDVRRPKASYLSDANAELMGFYSVLCNQHEELLAELRKLKYTNTSEAYYALRDSKPTDAVEAAARFIYLNKHGFNGLYRVNAKGIFNVPFGSYKRVSTMPRERSQVVADLFRQAYIKSARFDDVDYQVTRNTVVYFDPPYLGNFDQYTPEGFSREDHERLAALAFKLKRAGAHVFISASDTPESREVYGAFECVQLTARRSISAHSAVRGAKVELFYTVLR